MSDYILFCLIANESKPFSVYMPPHETVSSLKKSIISQGPQELFDFHAKDLNLWEVDKQGINPENFTDNNMLDPTCSISDYWKKAPPKKHTHVYIRTPDILPKAEKLTLKRSSDQGGRC